MFVLRQLDYGNKVRDPTLYGGVELERIRPQSCSPIIHNGCVDENATNPNHVPIMLWMGICGCLCKLVH